MTCRLHKKQQKKRSYCIITVAIMKRQLLVLVFTFIVLAVECSKREFYSGVCVDSSKEEYREENREYYAYQCIARCPNGYTRTAACTCEKNGPVQVEEKLYVRTYDKDFHYIVFLAIVVALVCIVIASPDLLYDLLKENGDVLEDAAHLFAMYEAEINV